MRILGMEIQQEDIATVIITLCLLLAWYITLRVFNTPLMSLAILWGGMILLSVVYSFVYWKRKRDMKVLKIRVIVSAVPIYSALALYVYLLLYGTQLPSVFRLLPIGIVGTMLLLNVGVIYLFSRKG